MGSFRIWGPFFGYPLEGGSPFLRDPKQDPIFGSPNRVGLRDGWDGRGAAAGVANAYPLLTPRLHDLALHQATVGSGACAIIGHGFVLLEGFKGESWVPIATCSARCS